jgi:hypothetical protein
MTLLTQRITPHPQLAARLGRSAAHQAERLPFETGKRSIAAEHSNDKNTNREKCLSVF